MQLKDLIPIEPHDVKMDMIITEKVYIHLVPVIIQVDTVVFLYQIRLLQCWEKINKIFKVLGDNN